MLICLPLNKVNPYTRKRISLDEVFSLINLDDGYVQQKVWKLFQPKIPNEFLGDDLYNLSEKYKLALPFPNAPMKILIKK